MKLYKNRDGKTLYPVCKWYSNQHKMYYWYEKAWLNREDNYCDKTEKEFERCRAMLEAFEDNCHDGFAYAEWPMVQQIKEAIVAYDLRH